MYKTRKSKRPTTNEKHYSLTHSLTHTYKQTGARAYTKEQKKGHQARKRTQSPFCMAYSDPTSLDAPFPLPLPPNAQTARA